MEFLIFSAVAILLIAPFTRKMNKSSKKSADEWYRRRHAEIQADQVDYKTNMAIYRNMMEKSRELKRRAASTGGYEKKQLLKEAENLERDARKYYRSLI